jgi:hypothetical protein
LIGKAEPFRKDSGKAAPENLFKKQEVVLLLHREHRDTENHFAVITTFAGRNPFAEAVSVIGPA